MNQEKQAQQLRQQLRRYPPPPRTTTATLERHYPQLDRAEDHPTRINQDQPAAKPPPPHSIIEPPPPPPRRNVATRSSTKRPQQSQEKEEKTNKIPASMTSRTTTILFALRGERRANQSITRSIHRGRRRRVDPDVMGRRDRRRHRRRRGGSRDHR